MKESELMKKLVAVLMSTMLLMMFTMGSFADVKDMDMGTRGTYWEYWEVEKVYKNDDVEPIGSWELCFVGEPAKRDGETQTASASLSVDASLGGSVKVPVKVIEANIDFSIGGSYSVGGYTTSSPLNKGDYIKGYARPVANVDKLIQRKYIHMDGQNIKTNTTATAYAYKPTAVNVDIEYFSSSKTRSEATPYKVEHYIFDMETNKTELIKTDYK